MKLVRFRKLLLSGTGGIVLVIYSAAAPTRQTDSLINNNIIMELDPRGGGDKTGR